MLSVTLARQTIDLRGVANSLPRGLTLRHIGPPRQFVARGFFTIAQIESLVRHHGMVPGLAVDGVDAAQLAVLVRRRGDQRDIALLANDQEQVLIGQQQHLAGAVAADAPAPRRGFSRNRRATP